jgi:hypothetical protein
MSSMRFFTIMTFFQIIFINGNSENISYIRWYEMKEKTTKKKSKKQQYHFTKSTSKKKDSKIYESSQWKYF